MNFEKKFENYLSEGLDPDELAQGKIVRSARVPETTGNFAPGSIVAFNYLFTSVQEFKRRLRNPSKAEENTEFGGKIIAVVVSNKRTKSGVFLSSKRNLLLSAFKIYRPNSGVINLILNSLYNHRERSTYRSIKTGLGLILGLSEYRTYDLGKVVHFHILKVSDGKE